MSAAARPTSAQSRRLRAPLLLALWALLALEAAGGLVVFFARLVAGTTPGMALHVGGGLALVCVYAAYQWTHWRRVAPWRPRLDYTLGLVAAASLTLALATGLPLAFEWWPRRADTGAPYTAWLSGAHNVMSMFVLTFAGAHLFAVLQRARRRS